MVTGLVKQFLKKTAIMTAGISILLAMGLVNVHAAKPPPVPLSCSISPIAGSVPVGAPVTLTATRQGGRGKITNAWIFASGSPQTSSENPVDVIYDAAGSYDVVSLVSGKTENGHFSMCNHLFLPGQCRQIHFKSVTRVNLDLHHSSMQSKWF